jgi:hypothetical protein
MSDGKIVACITVPAAIIMIAVLIFINNPTRHQKAVAGTASPVQQPEQIVVTPQTPAIVQPAELPHAMPTATTELPHGTVGSKPTSQEWIDAGDDENKVKALYERQLQWYRENPAEIPPPSPFRDEHSGKYGLSDVFSKVIVPATYDDMGDLSEGVAMVSIGDPTKPEPLSYSFIDITGQLLFPLRSDIYPTGPSHDTRFVGGLCPMARGHLVGGDIKDPHHVKLATVDGSMSKDDEVGFIDKSGSFAILPKYSDARLFSGPNGIAPVCIKISGKDKWGFINTHDHCVVPFKYDMVGGSTWQNRDDKNVGYEKPRMAIAYYVTDAQRLVWYEVDADGKEFSDEWSQHLSEANNNLRK